MALQRQRDEQDAAAEALAAAEKDAHKRAIALVTAQEQQARAEALAAAQQRAEQAAAALAKEIVQRSAPNESCEEPLPAAKHGGWACSSCLSYCAPPTLRRQRPMPYLMLQRCSKCGNHRAPARRQRGH